MNAADWLRQLPLVAKIAIAIALSVLVGIVLYLAFGPEAGIVGGGAGLLSGWAGVAGRRNGSIADQAHRAVSEDVTATERAGDEAVREAREEGDAAVTAADSAAEERIDGSRTDSPADIVNRLARGDG